MSRSSAQARAGLRRRRDRRAARLWAFGVVRPDGSARDAVVVQAARAGDAMRAAAERVQGEWSELRPLAKIPATARAIVEL